MSQDKKLLPLLSGPVRHACSDVIESPRVAVEKFDVVRRSQRV